MSLGKNFEIFDLFIVFSITLTFIDKNMMTQVFYFILAQ